MVDDSPPTPRSAPRAHPGAPSCPTAADARAAARRRSRSAPTSEATHGQLVGPHVAAAAGRGAPAVPARPAEVFWSATTPSQPPSPRAPSTPTKHATVDAVDDLPDDIESRAAPAATTAFLLEKASQHAARALRILGRRVLEVVDPAAANAEESARLKAEETDARAAAFLTLFDHGDGHRRPVRSPHPARRDAPASTSSPRCSARRSRRARPRAADGTALTHRRAHQHPGGR